MNLETLNEADENLLAAHWPRRCWRDHPHA